MMYRVLREQAKYEVMRINESFQLIQLGPDRVRSFDSGAPKCLCCLSSRGRLSQILPEGIQYSSWIEET